MSDSNANSLSEGEFMRLFVRHEPALRAYARSILPDWQAVDDAIQEASVTMWEKLPQLGDESGFLPWAKVILRFKCLAAITAARKSRHLLSDAVLKQLADQAETIQAEEVAAIRRALSSCLGKLEPSQQELLLAPYSGSGRVQELAEQCGKSANALYKLLGRLRDKLEVCVRSQLRAEGF